MRPGLLLEAAWWAFVAWLYGGDLLLRVRAAGAPVAALAALPSLPLSLLGTALALGGVALLVVARARPVPARWRPRRLALGATLAFALVDLSVFSARGASLGATNQLLLAVHGLADELNARAAPEGVPRDPVLLEEAVSALGPVPLFVDGERVPRWQLQLRERCDGPAPDAAGAAPGTLVYCVSVDRQRAWVSLVALPLGERFGVAALLGREPPAVAEVTVPAPPAPDDARPSQAPGPPVWGAPTPAPE